MNTETDLYETDAAFVEAWERWAEEQRRKVIVTVGYVTLPSMTQSQFEKWRQSGYLPEPELDQ